ncbi:hypothetical protein AAW14_33730 [Streptomyces hygroscopicus]|nr:hypothetical protein [Streptomyces hygroscopicus]
MGQQEHDHPVARRAAGEEHRNDLSAASPPSAAGARDQGRPAQRERLALLRPRHGVLVLRTLLRQDELRDPGDIAPSTPITDRELELAEALIRELAGINVGEVDDDYAHALEQLVDAKITGGELVQSAEPSPALDLMAALEASVRLAERAHVRPSARPRPWPLSGQLSPAGFPRPLALHRWRSQGPPLCRLSDPDVPAAGASGQSAGGWPSTTRTRRHRPNTPPIAPTWSASGPESLISPGIRPAQRETSHPVSILLKRSSQSTKRPSLICVSADQRGSSPKWRRQDSNLGRHSRQIYSPITLGKRTHLLPATTALTGCESHLLVHVSSTLAARDSFGNKAMCCQAETRDTHERCATGPHHGRRSGTRQVEECTSHCGYPQAGQKDDRQPDAPLGGTFPVHLISSSQRSRAEQPYSPAPSSEAAPKVTEEKSQVKSPK